MPAVFTPDNEPYLGRETVYVLDELIVAVLNLSDRIAAFTRANRASDLQEAAIQLVPQAINLTLSIRELIRQGYLFAAAVLLRSLVERTAVISFLWRNPEYVQVWHDGWDYKSRPKLSTMLDSMSPDDCGEDTKKVCDTLNHLVHGDPKGAYFDLVVLDDDAYGYAVGRVTDNGSLCDFVADQTIGWLATIAGVSAAIFPDSRASQDWSSSRMEERDLP